MNSISSDEVISEDTLTSDVLNAQTNKLTNRSVYDISHKSISGTPNKVGCFGTPSEWTLRYRAMQRNKSKRDDDLNLYHNVPF